MTPPNTVLSPTLHTLLLPAPFAPFAPAFRSTLSQVLLPSFPLLKARLHDRVHLLLDASRVHKTPPQPLGLASVLFKMVVRLTPARVYAGSHDVFASSSPSWSPCFWNGKIEWGEEEWTDFARDFGFPSWPDMWAFYKAEFAACDSIPFAGWILKWRRL